MPGPAPARNRFPLPALIGGGLLAASLIGVGLAAALTGGDDGQPNGADRHEHRARRDEDGDGRDHRARDDPAASRPLHLRPAGRRAGPDRPGDEPDEGTVGTTEALPIARRALQQLQGTGETYEGYANYNVGRSLVELDRCDEALPYLDRREQLLGPHPEVTAARRKCGVR